MSVGGWNLCGSPALEGKVSPTASYTGFMTGGS